MLPVVCLIWRNGLSDTEKVCRTGKVRKVRFAELKISEVGWPCCMALLMNHST